MKLALFIAAIAFLLYCGHRNHRPPETFWYEERSVTVDGETRTLVSYGVTE